MLPELKNLDKLIERASELKMLSAPELGTDPEEFHKKETMMLEEACDSNTAISSLGSKIEADLIEIELKSRRNLQKMCLLPKMVQQKTQKVIIHKPKTNLQEICERQTGMLEEACDSNAAISSLESKVEADLKETELQSCRNLKRMLLPSKMLQKGTRKLKTCVTAKHERNLQEVPETETKMIEKKKACASNAAISSLLSKVEAEIKETELQLCRNDNDMLLFSEMMLQRTRKLYIRDAAKYETNLQEVCEKETRMLEEEKACDSNAAISSLGSKIDANLLEFELHSPRNLKKHFLLKMMQEKTKKEIIDKVAKYKRNLEKVHVRETRMLEEDKACDSNGAISSLGHKIKAGFKETELQSCRNLGNMLLFSLMVREKSKKLETLLAAKCGRNLEEVCERETRMLDKEKACDSNVAISSLRSKIAKIRKDHLEDGQLYKKPDELLLFAEALKKRVLERQEKFRRKSWKRA